MKQHQKRPKDEPRQRKQQRRRTKADPKLAASSSSDDADHHQEEEDRKPPAREVVVPQQPQQMNNHIPRIDSADDGSSTASIMTPAYAAEPARLQLITAPSTDKVASWQPSNHSHSGTHTTAGTTAATNDDATLSHAEYQQLQRAIQRRLVWLASTLFLSTATFLYLVLPFYALISLLVMVCSSGMAANQAILWLRTEYNDRLAYQGFGEFLPTWLWDMLTQQSLHEVLTNALLLQDPNTSNSDSSVSQYLTLYLLPGLSVEQRNAYIRRLPARHRQLLERPGGLGQWVGGRDLMTLLMGQERLEQREQGLRRQRRRQPHIRRLEQEQAPTARNRISEQERLALEHATPAAGLQHDDDTASSHSDLGLEITENDLVGGLSEEEAQRVARRLRLTGEGQEERIGTIPEEETASQDDSTETESVEGRNEEEDNNALNDILMEAAWGSMWAQYESIFTPIAQYILGWASSATRQMAANYAAQGGQVALWTGGVGLLGYLTLGGGVQHARQQQQLVTTGTRSGPGSAALSLLGYVARDLVSPLFRARGTAERRHTWSMLVLGSGGAATFLYTTRWMLQPSSNKPKGDNEGSKKKE